MKTINIFWVLILASAILSCKKEENKLQLALNLKVTNATYSYDSNGSIILNISGGKAPYSFHWSNSAVTQNLLNLKPGNYSVTVTDANNTKMIDSASVGTDFYRIVHIHTDFGDIQMWLYDQTPLHRNNFLKLTDSGFYNNLTFHRVIDGFVIQGGDPNGDGTGGPGYDIKAEINSNIKHNFGAVGAARLPDNINPQRKSNGSQFYIVEGVNGAHSLDGLYTVFGQVLSGMNVVTAIAKVPKDSNDKPLTPVYMRKVETHNFTEKQLLDSFNFKIPKF